MLHKTSRTRLRDASNASEVLEHYTSQPVCYLTNTTLTRSPFFPKSTALTLPSVSYFGPVNASQVTVGKRCPITGYSGSVNGILDSRWYSDIYQDKVRQLRIMTNHEMELPRHDYYQTSTHLIAAVYIKGYAAEGIKEQVEVKFESGSVEINLPELENPGSGSKRKITFSPLYAEINPSGSSYRVLSTKIELKLAKSDGINWPTLLSTGETQRAGPSSQPIQPSASEVPVDKPKPKRKNWDTVVDDEEEESKDPNAGGEAALQKLFSTIYKDASDDTRRAMIKSYTESGGTTLSTDWSKIGQESTKVQPPEGMEAKKY